MIGASPFAAALDELEGAARATCERTYPERLYRALRAAIDEACGECELANLAGGGECPRQVTALIGYLLLLAGTANPARWSEVGRPGSSQQALDLLFELADALLGPLYVPIADPAAEGEDR
jgi:hypothetical protein